MKGTNKIIAVLSIILIIATLSINSFATKPSDFTGSDFQSEAVTNFGNQIIGVVRTVGVLISIVILLVLGIKYMMGSAEEKADYKKSMIPYLVGAVLIFASTAIVGIVYDAATALNGK